MSFRRQFFLILALGLILLGLAWTYAKKHSAAVDLPVYGKVPDFSLKNQDDQFFSAEQLKGKIWIANFIFTSCQHTCPMLTKRMEGVQGQLQDLEKQDPKVPLRIVSFSVDPERDSPAALKAYTQKYSVNPQIWNFLTGPLNQVADVVLKGFKISMGKVVEPNEQGSIYDVVHGERFVLIDQAGQIRGYFEANSAGIEKLLVGLKQLRKAS